MKATHEILTDALALLDEGRMWGKGTDGPGIYLGEKHCASLAVCRAMGYRDFHDQCEPSEPVIEACDALARAAKVDIGRGLDGIPEWNDAPERTFADVKGAFCRAIEATTPKVAVEAPVEAPVEACRV